MATARLAAGELELNSGVSGTTEEGRVDLTRQTVFRVTPTRPSTARELINQFVRPLQDLLIFSIGLPIRLTMIQLRPTKSTGAGTGLGEAYFEAVQPSTSKVVKQADVHGSTAPTILTRRSSPLPFDQLLPAWFDLWERHREVVTLLVTPFYAPFIYSEHGFASTFQSAEALHNALCDGKDLTKTAHDARVTAAIKALREAQLDPEDVRWAKGVLSSRNDKPLWRRIHDLVESAGVVGQAILATSPNFGNLCAGAHTGVSHPGSQKRLSAVERHWYAVVLRWLVRTHLLMLLLGDPRRAQEIVMNRSSFQHAVKQLHE